MYDPDALAATFRAWVYQNGGTNIVVAKQFLDRPDVVFVFHDNALIVQRTVMEAKMFNGNYIDAIRDFPVISFFHTCEQSNAPYGP